MAVRRVAAGVGASIQVQKSKLLEHLIRHAIPRGDGLRHVPRTVARAQLPSPRTLSIGAVIWYTDLLETPSLAQGTYRP